MLAMLAGYVLTVLVEAPILVLALRGRPVRDRLIAGLWLNAVSYPLVWMVVPTFADPARDRVLYLVVAETLAPVVECLAFRAAFPDATWREMGAIVVANLASFGAGELGLCRLLEGL